MKKSEREKRALEIAPNIFKFKNDDSNESKGRKFDFRRDLLKQPESKHSFDFGLNPEMTRKQISTTSVSRAAE